MWGLGLRESFTDKWRANSQVSWVGDADDVLTRTNIGQLGKTRSSGMTT